MTTPNEIVVTPEPMPAKPPRVRPELWIALAFCGFLGDWACGEAHTSKSNAEAWFEDDDEDKQLLRIPVTAFPAADLLKRLTEAKKRIATLETVHKQDDEIIKALEFNIEHVEKRLAGLVEAARQSKKLIEAFVERWPVDFLYIPGVGDVYNVLAAALASAVVGGTGST